jgi:hypothetical protein
MEKTQSSEGQNKIQIVMYIPDQLNEVCAGSIPKQQRKGLKD